jgi:hypothetical protein
MRIKLVLQKDQVGRQSSMTIMFLSQNNKHIIDGEVEKTFMELKVEEAHYLLDGLPSDH